MDKKTLLRYTGSMQQVAYVRPVEFRHGRARGLNAVNVKSGPLSFQVMQDKCLDISEVSFKGININFLSKPGLQGLGHYDTNGAEAIRSIMGGLFFTAGCDNICAPCTQDGTDYPMHGRMRSTPAEHLCADAFWDAKGDYVLRVAGEMRQAALFGENTVLRRTITSILGSDTITVDDELENQSFAPQPCMLLYHINLGWPFLSERTRFLIPTKSVTPRDEVSKGHEDAYDRMDPPKDNEPEYVFIHDLKTDAMGDTHVLAVNDELAIGMELCFNTRFLPNFMQWKSTASGDYVMGLEPANASVYGRPWHTERDSLPTLAPLERRKLRLEFSFFSGPDIKARQERFGQDFG